MDKDAIKHNNKEIGRRIRGVRKKHDLTQEDMADKLGIKSTPHYQNIEYGKSRVTIPQLQILYEEFGASPNYILLGKAESEQEWMYDYLSLPDEEKFTMFIEIVRQALCGPQCDFEVFIKKKDDNLLKGDDK